MKHKYFYIITIIYFLTNFLTAQDGVLDPTFGSGGIITTPIGSSADVGQSLAIQSDGKIVVAGYSDNGTNLDFAIVRYNSDGSLDNSFDSDGKVTTQIGSSYDYGLSVAIQSDGKIVVAGYSNNGSDTDFALVRYNSDGSLDNSFDSDGKVTTPIGSGFDYGYSVAIQSDGKIVVAGDSYNGSNFDFAIVRYNIDGSLDNSFDSDGKVTTPIGPGNDYGRSVAIQSDGKIVVAGETINVSNADFAIVRYNIDGSLDNSFDSDGKVTTSIGASTDVGRSVAIQSDGKIVVAGYSNNGSNLDFAIVCYNIDGSLNSSFDFDGKVTTPIGSASDYAYSVAIQSDGKIVVAGDSDNGSNSTDFAVAVYNNPSLPVELTTFTGTLTSSADGSLSVNLNWETATEVNNYGFEIERQNAVVSSQKSEWEKIAFVEGHGNSNSPKYYSYSDISINLSGRYLYRLKQLDIDGSYEYSDEVEVNFGSPTDFELSQNYPNPFNPTTSIKFNLPTDSNIRLNVFNVLGEEVAELINNNMQAGFHSVEFDASSLNSGIYFYKVEAGIFVQIRKMMLLK